VERAIPILPISDLDLAGQFYVERLGFNVGFEYRAESNVGLLGIERGGIVMTLDCPMDERGRNACVSLKAEDAARY